MPPSSRPSSNIALHLADGDDRRTAALRTLSERLALGVAEVTKAHPDWSFMGDAQRGDIHDIAQYPAMMVPRMQGMLMDAAASALGHSPTVFDPFVGSGTTLVEAMRRGWHFIGRDINPLAILLCKAKAENYKGLELASVLAPFEPATVSDCTPTPVWFPGIDKWFNPTVIEALARLRTQIRSQQDVRVRRLLWCTLAETIRTTSNSRTSTFKLHVRLPADRVCTGTTVFQRFYDNLNNTLAKVEREERRRAELSQPPPTPELKVRDVIGDSLVRRAHLLITSPPYGDNTTTVPYGQFSFLPLNWIDFADIDASLQTVALKNTHALDSGSLGGTRKGAAESLVQLRDVSDTLCRFVDELEGDSTVPASRRRDGALRALAFARDLALAVNSSVLALSAPAFSIWTVGNRRIAGREFPLSSILSEFLRERGAQLVAEIPRTIPSKRMALKNKLSPTMRTERVLIMLHHADGRRPPSGGMLHD